MFAGKVKWFDADKLYGFIQPDDGSPEIFLHASNLSDAAPGGLLTGISVRYSIGRKGGKIFAERVRIAVASEALPRPTRNNSRESDDDFADAFEKEWGLRRS